MLFPGPLDSCCTLKAVQANLRLARAVQELPAPMVATFRSRGHRVLQTQG